MDPDRGCPGPDPATVIFLGSCCEVCLASDLSVRPRLKAGATRGNRWWDLIIERWYKAISFSSAGAPCNREFRVVRKAMKFQGEGLAEVIVADRG